MFDNFYKLLHNNDKILLFMLRNNKELCYMTTKKMLSIWGLNCNINTTQFLLFEETDSELFMRFIKFLKFRQNKNIRDREKLNLRFRLLKKLGHYKGKRLIVGLPLNAQRTHTNAQTFKKYSSKLYKQ